MKNLFPKCIFRKQKWVRIKEEEKGFTLVELIIVIALIGLISTVVASMFITGIRSFDTADEQVESYSSGRMAFMNLERQTKSSEEIFIKDDGVIYIQDLETQALYNYFTLNVDTGRIMKYKVNKDTLDPIEGSTSQFAENITGFELKHIEDNVFQLQVTSEVNGGKRLELNSEIRVGVKITQIP